MKKLTLTSVIGILIAAPALAAVGDTTFDASYTVAGACVVGVTGVSSGTANATAQWTTNSYTCAAGTYLPNGNSWTSDNQYTDNHCATCAANSYCVGSSTSSDATQGKYVYDATTTKGTQTCPSGFPSSDAGSDAESDCYRTCTTSDVAHSANVTGRYYSGETSASNSCEPTETNGCATGYHYVAGVPDLNTLIGTDADDNYTTDSSTMTFSVDYGNKGTVTGKAQCNTQGGTNNDWTWSNPTISSTLPASSGQYCWCSLDGYTPDGESAQSLSGSWVFYGFVDAGTCADDCAGFCADGLRLGVMHYPAFRAAVFGSVQSSPAHCEANEITISWKNASGTEHASTTCTYDGAITTPTTEPAKRGHTFAGWKFTAQ